MSSRVERTLQHAVTAAHLRNGACARSFLDRLNWCQVFREITLTLDHRPRFGVFALIM